MIPKAHKISTSKAFCTTQYSYYLKAICFRLINCFRNTRNQLWEHPTTSITAVTLIGIIEYRIRDASRINGCQIDCGRRTVGVTLSTDMTILGLKFGTRWILSKVAAPTVAIPIAVGLSMMTTVIVIWQLVKNDQTSRLNAETRSNVEYVSAQLEAHIATRLGIGEQIRSRWLDGNVNTQEAFRYEANSAHNLFQDIQAINWIDPQGIIRWTTPSEGNEAAQGLNIRSLPVPNTALVKAESTGQLQVTAPFNLAQGGTGFVAYIPLISNDSLEGFINIVFRISPLIKGTLRDDIEDNHHLVITDGEVEVYNSNNMYGLHAHQVYSQIAVANRLWNVSLMPNGHLADIHSTLIDEIILTVGLALSMVVSVLVWQLMIRQKTLQERERQFREIIDNLPLGFYAKDLQGRHLIVNSMYSQRYGLSEEQMIGRTNEELFPNNVASNKSAREQEAAVRSRRETAFREQQKEFVDGKMHHLFITKFPIIDTNGEIVAIGMTGVDVTAIKDAEEVIRKTEERLRSAVDSLQEGFALYDAEDRLVAYNESLMKINPSVVDMPEGGLTYEELLRLNVQRGVFVDAIGREDEFIRERVAHHQNPTAPVIRQWSDGTWYIIKESKTAEGGIALTYSDITDLKNIENELMESKKTADKASRAKSEFLASMSHELRTPLNAILGFSEILRGEYFGPLGSQKYMEYVRDITSSSEHLQNLINDILDLSAIEAGEHRLTKEALEIKGICEDCSRYVVNAAGSKGITYNVEVTENLPPLHADGRAIKQILLNLLSNAVKFSPTGGQISLKVTQLDGQHVFEVHDTGTGIEQDFLPKLTDPFVRAVTDPHLTQEGTGLGLSIVKSLIDLHQGELSFVSEVGKGTMVSVTLPSDEGGLKL